MQLSPYAAVVDPLFKAAGFEVGTGMVQRTISGRYAGRECRILLSPMTRTRYSGEVRQRQYLGHRLYIFLAVAPRTRCGLFRREALRPWAMRLKRWLGARPVEPMPSALPLLACWGAEPDWAAGWLAGPGVQETLLRLFTDEQSPRMQSISLDPVGRISLTVQHLDVRRIAPERFEHWLADLNQLAVAVDAATPPLRVLSQTPVERFIERHPVAAAVGLLLAMFAVLIVATPLILGPLFLLFRWLIR